MLAADVDPVAFAAEAEAALADPDPFNFWHWCSGKAEAIASLPDENLRARIINRSRADDLTGAGKPRVIKFNGEARDHVTEEWPAALDLIELAARTPVTPRHIIPGGWLPAGEVTLFPGHGGAGKSGIALYTGACIYLEALWCGLQTEQRPVTVISAEDGAEVLHWRLSRIAAYLGVSLSDLGGLQIIDASHIDAELMREIPYSEPVLTPLYSKLRDLHDPAGVLILDGVSDLYGASEIVRRHVRRFVRALRKLINADGAVLALAHVDKAAARDGGATDRYSGSTAWHNSVRARWSLTAGDNDALTLALAKANHAKAGAEIRFRWDAQAHLYAPDPVTAEGGIAGAIRERQERDGIVAAFKACSEPIPAATTGQRTAWHVLSARSELPQSLRDGRDGRRKFWAHIEALRQMKIISEGSYRRSNRHVLATLELSTERRAECAE
jgi:RecA-family ATPase